MGKKVALNVFYNIAIFLCIVIVWNAVEAARWEYVLACAFIAGIIITLKIRLIKEIREMQNNK
ncbi:MULTISPECIES: DUF6358 family protein [Mucilaginibacter]|uniref:DUF6358 family protein n=1 Tax=Mucilaginibacter TaxID=423349 RepID=UPI002090CE12|nr:MULTISPECIES: DUF6358 family protein [Mucilaginibacter]MCO5936961.1 DUF6358 family protein [Mucilaginibacter aurantiaciroseus]MEB0260917.1 DUF6358 family protein [Mucilaginibacter sp. 10I4]MEB0279846.1 DUF6358 family protein [Mucilaginibacter sp. 10B2]MEB0302806.1 DUF6358 family protein [Mucilaginibacter sp. 5C4]WPX24183.1 DUF6358 family protein [Mucilaginibacter sp. 5C4]